MYWSPYVLGKYIVSKASCVARRSTQHAEDGKETAVNALKELRLFLYGNRCRANVRREHLVRLVVACVERVHGGIFDVSFELPIFLE